MDIAQDTQFLSWEPQATDALDDDLDFEMPDISEQNFKANRIGFKPWKPGGMERELS